MIKLRLVTAQEMAAMDQIAIKEYGIPGVVLMENAGLKVAEIVASLLNNLSQSSVMVFAGKGNNGGDGFVAARHLHNRGAEVQVFLATEAEKVKGDALINLNIWRKMGQKVYQINKNNDVSLVRLALMKADLVIDALYGTGFKGSMRDQMVPIIEAINASGKTVVSVDIPSGLEADTGRTNGPCIAARHTVTFALPKLGLVLPNARPYVGELHVVDISIPNAITTAPPEVGNLSTVNQSKDDKKNVPESKGLIKKIKSSNGESINKTAGRGFTNLGSAASDKKVSGSDPLNGGSKRYLITEQMVRSWWPRRTGTEHKGNFGRVLLIAGSRGMSGAAVLAAQATARSGAGLVTLGVPVGIHDIVEAKLTEVMTFPLPQTDRGTICLSALEEIIKRANNNDVLALGPGLGTGEDIADIVKEILLHLNIPCVLDADGLNVLAGKTELFKAIRTDLVLTPHPGEMARLTGRTIDQIQNDRLGTAAAKAAQWDAVVALKGAGTVVAGPDGTIFINNTGNPGMAAGGSGDVLTGIIAGLLGQGMQALHAAAAGVCLHGLAGDKAVRNKGMSGLLASDLLEQLPAVLRTME